MTHLQLRIKYIIDPLWNNWIRYRDTQIICLRIASVGFRNAEICSRLKVGFPVVMLNTGES